VTCHDDYGRNDDDDDDHDVDDDRDHINYDEFSGLRLSGILG